MESDPSLTPRLFEVNPADPLIYVAIATILLLVAEFASWLPARSESAHRAALRRSNR